MLAILSGVYWKTRQKFSDLRINLVGRIDQRSHEVAASYKIFLGDHLVEKIRDAAAQKGTGKWAVIEAMNAGVPATVINESVSARFVSALKDDRVAASTKLVGPSHQKFDGNLASMVDDIRKVT